MFRTGKVGHVPIEKKDSRDTRVSDKSTLHGHSCLQGLTRVGPLKPLSYPNETDEATAVLLSLEFEPSGKVRTAPVGPWSVCSGFKPHHRDRLGHPTIPTLTTVTIPPYLPLVVVSTTYLRSTSGV